MASKLIPNIYKQLLEPGSPLAQAWPIAYDYLVKIYKMIDSLECGFPILKQDPVEQIVRKSPENENNFGSVRTMPLENITYIMADPIKLPLTGIFWADQPWGKLFFGYGKITSKTYSFDECIWFDKSIFVNAQTMNHIYGLHLCVEAEESFHKFSRVVDNISIQTYAVGHEAIANGRYNCTISSTDNELACNLLPLKVNDKFPITTNLCPWISSGVNSYIGSLRVKNLSILVRISTRECALDIPGTSVLLSNAAFWRIFSIPESREVLYNCINPEIPDRSEFINSLPKILKDESANGKRATAADASSETKKRRVDNGIGVNT